MSAPRHPAARFRTIAGRRWKLCGGCDEWFVHDVAHFYRNGGKPDGLDSQCRGCVGARCARHTQQMNAERRIRRLLQPRRAA